ncbi:MAG: tetratricopeptide repeat protein [Armatimonadota bacterium]
MTMRLIRLMFAGAMCVGLLSVGQAQGSDREIREQADAAVARADALWREQRYDEAIAALREAATISERLSYFTSRYHHHLAKVLVRTGRKDEALEAYRKAFRWDAELGELDFGTAPAVQEAMEYAILLAQAGREEDAKAMYYYGLRIFNRFPGGILEPFPFLVVFDPDPVMQYWPYSVENFTAAATVLTADLSGPYRPYEKVRQMKPDWILPAIYNVWQPLVDGQERERLAAAMRLARTQEEREWAALYQPMLELTDWQEQLHMFDQVADRLAAIGAERRKNSVVLRRAKENLRNIHHRIAVTRDR